MQWNEFVRDYFNFSRKERIGNLIIAVLILIIYFLPVIVDLFSRSEPAQVDPAWIAAVKKLEKKDSTYLTDRFVKDDDENVNTYQYDRKKSNYAEGKMTRGELFHFDPNTISSEGWKKLGLRDKTIHTIQNFVNKGGHFYKPEDLQRIYGLHTDEYERLVPYVKIESTAPVTHGVLVSKPKDETWRSTSKRPGFFAIDINSADTSAFISLPGIGSKLASRIVTFREKLGGFYSIDQIAETYGLTDSVFQKIKQYLRIENPYVKKININTATLDELKVHPYIKFNLANPIVAYRNEHGIFTKVEDLRNIMAVTDDIYEKISPYLSVN